MKKMLYIIIFDIEFFVINVLLIMVSNAMVSKIGYTINAIK